MSVLAMLLKEFTDKEIRLIITGDLFVVGSASKTDLPVTTMILLNEVVMSMKMSLFLA